MTDKQTFPSPMIGLLHRRKDSLKAATLFDKAAEAEALFEVLTAVLTDYENRLRRIERAPERIKTNA